MVEPIRLVTVWCPDWPMVVAGIEPTIPAAVLRANRVVARTVAAAEEGVDIGQRRREARRRCPELLLLESDVDRDASGFESVVRAVGRFTPRVEVVEPGLLCFAARGPSRYFGGEEAFSARLLAAARSAAAEVGPSARVQVGVADGRFASLVAANRAGHDPLLVGVGESPAFLAPLPVAWLARTGEASVDLVDLLVRLGVRNLGDLAALGASDVLARFGPEGSHAHRIAGGTDERGAETVAPPEDLVVEATFDTPVALLDPLVFTAKTLADDLASRLAGNGLVCSRLMVVAETAHGERDERTWYRAAGMSAAELLERVRWQLSGWTGSGEISSGVVLLRLVPVEVRGDGGEQAALWGGTSVADERAVRAVARLTSLVGDHGVLVPSWRGGRLPAERCGWVPAAAVDLTDGGDVRRRLGPLAEGKPTGRGDDPVSAPWPGSLSGPSPTVVLPEPEPALLAGADGRAVRVSGRGELSAPPVTLQVGGRVPRLLSGWAGPWIIDERWWDVTGRRRLARVQVTCDDGAAYLVAAEQRRWWLLASYR
ncbi:MAG: DNA polymerase Y family protein [Acidimicrobiales bacterium]|nr:DNA polymerase Y family protein [Acidimicrobiales bacterium]